ncbi:fimbrial protein [Pseudomonas aeruginosa]|uniref:fimbrial protein n=1 Tax=Pseudomonas aeruginosa TaxID=287 RepID=UPI0009A9F642|nr:fimbrial protein [Pseudomonas aeruginosa]MBF8800241.1 fimbrial protein [Pseudomonas aeruginosa]MBG4274218.1 fimbrial protein [Pseudomonas aeruginosa]MBG4981353.1 fimbrial protein [Pseudomonas aeruginosa]MBG6830455.1 fimbrial protein [Pseudomonas aeruginosa]MBN7870349.1 fimbrial protein [Pseudomonas aeruginosa]
MNKKRLIFIGLCTLFLSAHAFALCKSDTTDGNDYYIVHVYGFKPPPFSPGDIPIGGIIYESKSTALNFINAAVKNRPEVTCNPRIRDYSVGVGVLGPNNVYSTSIPNIGIRVLDPNHNGAFPILNNSIPWENVYWNMYYAPTIQLIKTGNITAPGVLTGAYARYTANSPSGQTLVEYRFASPLNVTPRVPTCSLETPSPIPVSLGHITAAMVFSGVGSTAPMSSPFEIRLNCSGGDPETMTKVFVTLTDATNPGNTSKILSLTKASGATGVGVQILKDDTVLGYGPDSNSVGNTNQWYAGSVKQGETGMRFSLQARYIQTAERITSGSANAVATFNLSYQ